jgi:glutamyl-tRNA reductase
MFNGEAYTLDGLADYKKGFDILIACTGATHAIITSSLYEHLLQGDTDKKIVIDLSVPNNIASDIPKNFNTTYIEIDGLKEVVSANMAFREKEVIGVQAILDKRVSEFRKIYRGRQVELALREVPAKIKALREHAISSVFKNEVSSLDDDAQELIGRMMAYMEKRCIAIPIQAAKEHLAGVVSLKK